MALLAATLASIVVALEVGARLLTRTPAPLGERHPVVGRTYRPGFRGTVFVDEAGREIHLRFNREGFRGDDLSRDRPPGTARIAVLGDSFVASLACDEDDTAVRRLESLLHASRPDVQWEILNFGVSGASTGQELALYRHVVRHYRPDVVLVAYYVGNDFSDNSTALSSYPRVYFELDAHGNLVARRPSKARSRLSAWLNRHSRFYVWQKTANDVLRHRTVEGNLAFVSETSPELESVWELNARILEAFRDDVEADGAGLAVAVLPSGSQVYDDVWDGVVSHAGEDGAALDRDHPDRRLERIVDDLGIPAVFLGPAFRRAARGRTAADTPDDRLLFFGGDGHFTARGNAVAAEEIHRFLIEGAGRRLLDGIGPGPARDP